MSRHINHHMIIGYAMPQKADNTSDTTHFGFRTVETEKKASMVRGVFDNVAKNYDIMNDVMSGGMHRLWKASLIDSLRPRPGQRFLDVAGGTGDISFRILDRLRELSATGRVDDVAITVSDINEAMLEEGKKRAIDRGYMSGLEWVPANAEELPFADETFDAYTIAFGIRNVTHVDKALEEAYRVLKPGGKFLCLEFSKPVLPGFGKVYDWYSFNVIPTMGGMIADDKESYQYLVESIRNFPRQDDFAAMIKNAGFTQVGYRNMTGGVVALHKGIKA